MEIIVDDTCPFEHGDFPHCQAVSRDKETWCNPNGKIHENMFAPPPPWCPLRKEPVVVKLISVKPEQDGEAYHKWLQADAKRDQLIRDLQDARVECANAYHAWQEASKSEQGKEAAK